MNYAESAAVIGLFVFLVAVVSLALSLVTPEEDRAKIIRMAFKNFWLVSLTAGAISLAGVLINMIF